MFDQVNKAPRTTPAFGRKVISEVVVEEEPVIEKNLATKLDEHVLSEEGKAKELVRLLGLLGKKHDEIVGGLQNKISRIKEGIESRLEEGAATKLELEALIIERDLLQNTVDKVESEKSGLVAELGELTTAVENVLSPKVSALNEALDSARVTVKKWIPEPFDVE